MADGVELAVGYISLVPSAKGIVAGVESELGGPLAAAGAASGAKTSTSFKSAFKSGLKGLAVGAGVIAGIVAIGVKFDDAFNTIARGTGATGKTLDGLDASFKRVLAAGSGSFDQVSAAVSTLYTRTGLTGKALDDFAAKEVTLARITKTDVNANLQATTGLFNLYGVAAGQQSDTLDTLFRASQVAGVSITQLAGDMQTAAPTAKTLGLSIDQTAAIVANLDKAGLPAGKVMLGLASSFAKAAKAGKDPLSVIADLVDEVKKAPNATAAATIAVSKFGIGARQAATLVAGLRSGAINLNATLSGGKGILETAAATQTLSGKLAHLRNVALVGAEPLATQALGALTRIVTDLIPVVTLLSAHMDVLGPIILSAAAAFVVFKTVVGIKSLITGTVGAFNALKGALVVTESAEGGVAAAMTATSEASAGAIATQTASAEAASASSVALGTLADAALAAAGALGSIDASALSSAGALSTQAASATANAEALSASAEASAAAATSGGAVGGVALSAASALQTEAAAATDAAAALTAQADSAVAAATGGGAVDSVALSAALALTAEAEAATAAAAALTGQAQAAVQAATGGSAVDAVALSAASALSAEAAAATATAEALTAQANAAIAAASGGGAVDAVAISAATALAAEAAAATANAAALTANAEAATAAATSGGAVDAVALSAATALSTEAGAATAAAVALTAEANAAIAAAAGSGAVDGVALSAAAALGTEAAAATAAAVGLTAQADAAVAAATATKAASAGFALTNLGFVSVIAIGALAAAALGKTLFDLAAVSTKANLNVKGAADDFAHSLIGESKNAVEAAGSIDHLTEATTKWFKSQGAADEQTGGSIIRNLGISYAEVTKQVTGTSGGIDQFVKSLHLSDVNADILSGGLHKLRDSLQDQARATITNFEGTKVLSKAQVAAAVASTKAADGSTDWVAALRDLGSVSATVSAAEGATTAQLDIQRRSWTDLTSAIIGNTDALRGSQEGVLGVLGASVSAQQGLVQVASAQKDYNDAVKKFGANSSQAHAALLTLQSTQISQKQSVLSAVDATEKWAAEQSGLTAALKDQASALKKSGPDSAAYAKATDVVKVKQTAFKHALEAAAAETTGPVHDALVGYINDTANLKSAIDKVPPTKTVTYVTPGLDAAFAKTHNYRGELSGIPLTSKTTISVDVASAIHSVTTLEQKIHELTPNLPLRISVGEGRAGNPVLPGNAAGGTIPPKTWHWTGEEGPELVFGGMTGATVLSHSKSLAAVSADDMRSSSSSRDRLVVQQENHFDGGVTPNDLDVANRKLGMSVAIAGNL